MNQLETDTDNIFESTMINPFFSPYPLQTLLLKLKRKDYNGRIERNNLLLDLIRQKQPISKYELAKITNHAYDTIKQFCKWAEASDFISSKTVLGQNGLYVQLVYVCLPKNSGVAIK